MADVAQAVVARDDGFRSASRHGQGPRHVTDRADTPEPTLYARWPGGRLPVADRHVANAAATSRTWTKSLRWQPSSNTLGASPRSSAEGNTAATPAYGVFLGMPGP